MSLIHALSKPPLNLSSSSIRRIACLVLIISLSCTLYAFDVRAEAGKKIVLYNWEDYMPQFALDEFEAETGTKVELVFYETDELKDELIYTTRGKGLDLIIGTGFSFAKYIRRGDILQSFDSNKLSNYEHIDQMWYDKQTDLKDYSIPLWWGTLGIIYRKDLVKEPVTDWMSLFRPEKSLQSRIIMVNDIRDSMSAALLALGYSINSTSPREISAAGALMLEQRPFVRAYRYINVSEESELLDGSVHMTLGYNGDAVILKSFNDNIEFLVPDNGTQLWADHIAVLQTSKNKKAAYAFIDFINQPERAARIAEAIGYASANKGALAHMQPEHKNNPDIYPSKQRLEKSEFTQELTPRLTSIYNTVFINSTK